MKAKRWLIPIAGLFILLAIWSAVVHIFSLPTYLVPAPQLVLEEFLSAPYDFAGHAAWTLAEALAGFSIALVVGLLGGCLLFRVKTLWSIALPWASALQAIPIVAIAPLFVIWCGSGIVSKIAMSAIISFFPILTAVLNGFSEVDRNQQMLFNVYKVNYLRTLRHLLLPSAIPTIVLGTKISAGLATVGAIVAEMTGADKGLGYLLLNATYRLETPRLFVAIILSGIIGWSAYTLPGILRVIFPKYWESLRRGVTA